MRKFGKILYSRAGHRWIYNMAHAPFLLDTSGYKHPLRICDTYCFCTTTLVTTTCLRVALYI